MISQTLKELIQSTIIGTIEQSESMGGIITTKHEVYINEETQELALFFYYEGGNSADLYEIDGDRLNIVEYGAIENKSIEESYLDGFVKIEL